MKSLILIIDTAHPTARVVLADGETIVGKREWENTPKVGTELLLFIDEVLQEAGKQKEDVDRIAVHAGPGSFGLVRTGITTATMLARAIRAELVGVAGETEQELLVDAIGQQPVEVIEPKYS